MNKKAISLTLHHGDDLNHFTRSEMKNILLILVIVLVSNTFGKVSTDSLEALLPGLEDSKQVKILNELAFELCRISPEKSISYANQALELARKYQNKEQEAEALINIANIYRGSGEFDKALEYLQQAFSLSENIQYQKGMARSLTSFGAIYDYQGDYDKALENYFKALALCEKMDDKEGIGGTLMGIGIIYWYLKDNNKALDYYLQAEKAYEEGSFDHGLAAIANNIGLIYMGQEKYDKALEYYKKALSIHKKNRSGSGHSRSNFKHGCSIQQNG